MPNRPTTIELKKEVSTMVKVVATIIGSLVTLSLGAGATALVNHESRLAVVETTQDKDAEHAVPESRVVVLETKMDAVQAEIKSVGGKVDTLQNDMTKGNSKLDILLGRLGTRHP